MLSRRHNISIDRVVGAPRYRKYNVDERNATDKRFLKFKIFLIGTPEIVTRKRRMEAAAMIEGDKNKILATECIRLCSEPNKFIGMKSDKKHRIGQANSRIKIRHYHLQK